jgi:hypothetical protein
MERSPRIPLPPGEQSAEVYRPELANALSTGAKITSQIGAAVYLGLIV